LKLEGGTGNGPIGPGPIIVAGGAVEVRNDASNVYGNHVNVTAAGVLVVWAVSTGTNQTITLGNLGQGGTGALNFVSNVGYVTNVANVNLPGGFVFGNVANFINVGTSSLVVAAGGNVIIGGSGTGNFRVGSKNIANTSGTINNTFNASEAASFVVNVANVEIATEPVTGVNNVFGTLSLPASATIIGTTRIAVADTANQGGTGVINLGAGTTTFTTPTMIVGGRKGNGTINVPAGASVNIGNGAGRTALSVGAHTIDTGVTSTSTFNLGTATLTASLGQVLVGHRGSSAASTASNSSITGTWDLGTNAATNVSMLFDTGSPLVIGRNIASLQTNMGTRFATGTVNIRAGTVSISTASATAPGITLGLWGNTGTGGIETGNTNISANGNLNISGGTVSVTTGGGPAISMTPENAFVTLAPYRLNANLAVSGGSLSLGNDIAVGVAQGATTSTSTIDLTGGTLDMNGNDIGAVTNLTFSGGTLREVGNLLRPLTQNGASSQFVVSGADTNITGLYTLTAGSAMVEANRTLAPSGTIMADGTLTVNGTLTGTLNVSAGVVSGNGVLGTTTFTGGVFSPGIGTGQIDTGSLTLGAASKFEMAIGGLAAGTTYDLVSVAGSLTLAGSLEASLTNGFVPPPFAPFFILLNDGIDPVSGTFAGLPEGAPINIGGVGFNITYAANGDGGGVSNDVALVVVPEPGSLALFLGGLGAMLGMRRRTRRGTR
jgi:hypothetical protein